MLRIHIGDFEKKIMTEKKHLITSIDRQQHEGVP